MRGTKTTSNISPDDWYAYFNGLYNDTKYEFDPVFTEYIKSYVEDYEADCEINMNEEIDGCIIDEPINVNEIENAIKSLPNGKDPGPDGILNEHERHPMFLLLPRLTILFNTILQSGNYPKLWCTAGIVPLHKHGQKTDPGNYRVISLLSVIGKVFTKILNTEMCEAEDLLYEEQSGYRKKDKVHLIISFAYMLWFKNTSHGLF
ncbi:hypothetical protein SNE40_023482 [Patella caerulea]|uniref:Uncharacterized protein n=1 Tax=Patella caerulea TaxID=87958 RepID=A0AAN8GC36_PATCE